MKKIAVIGHFAFGKEYLDGQTVKTKIITEELERKFGKKEVLKYDTHGSKLKFLTLPFVIFYMLSKCENVIIFPAQNGVKILVPLLVFSNTVFRKKLHYVVIGGWLAEFIEQRKHLKRLLKKFNHIYVETNAVKKILNGKGFSNVLVMPNCKKLKIRKEKDLVCSTEMPYKLCTFSRVMKEKGIEDVINAVKCVNQNLNTVGYSLDIYGPIDAKQEEWFARIQRSLPEYIRYCGTVPFDKSVEVLGDYFALVFPTQFYTEGVPGTIIDAYAAGVPVISSKWESFCDVVEDGKTGIGYEFGDIKNLEEVLKDVLIHPEKIFNMKQFCIEKAVKNIPEEVVNILIYNLT